MCPSDTPIGTKCIERGIMEKYNAIPPTTPKDLGVDDLVNLAEEISYTKCE